MVCQENCSMFFFPDSASPAKKIPLDFIAYDERELGHIHLKYILAEKVYLNLYLRCAPVSSLEYQALHQQASIWVLLFCSWWTQEEKLCWFVRSTLTTVRSIHKADMASLVDFDGPTSSADTRGSTQGDVALLLRGGRRKFAWISHPPLPGKSVSIQGHRSCLHTVTKSGNPLGW